MGQGLAAPPPAHPWCRGATEGLGMQGSVLDPSALPGPRCGLLECPPSAGAAPSLCEASSLSPSSSHPPTPRGGRTHLVSWEPPGSPPPPARAAREKGRGVGQAMHRRTPQPPSNFYALPLLYLCKRSRTSSRHVAQAQVQRRWSRTRDWRPSKLNPTRPCHSWRSGLNRGKWGNGAP